jgi:hypothetical protein
VITASRMVVKAVMLVADVTGGIVASSVRLRNGRRRDGANAQERNESTYIP